MIPILSLLILVPFLGGLVTMVTSRNWPCHPRYLALIATAVTLVLSLYAFGTVFGDDEGNADNYGLSLWENYPLLEDQGVSIQLGVDGLSAPMVLLTGLLGILTVIFAWDESKRPNQFFGLMLLLQASLFGVFTCVDYFVFYIFWEAVLIPMFFLIGVWGGDNRRYASIKFFLYTFTASMVMLVGIMALYFQAGARTFNMMELAQEAPGFSRGFQLWVFGALFFGFAVKVPVVPWHTWLPDAHVEAPTAGSAWLAGVMLKMGAYGLIRAALPMAPEGAEAFVPVMVILAVASILYGALLSLGQKDLKKLVAYASISHMGIALLGIATLTPLGLAGAVFMMFAHGIISPAMFMIAGTLQHRVGTRRIPQLSGLANRMPLVGSLWLIIFLGSLGLPGMAAFIAEFSVFVAFWGSHGWWLVLPIIGVLFSAAYHLWALQRALFGPLRPDLEDRTIADGSWNENLPVAVLMMLAVLFGILPALVMDMADTSVVNILDNMGVL